MYWMLKFPSSRKHLHFRELNSRSIFLPCKKTCSWQKTFQVTVDLTTFSSWFWLSAPLPFHHLLFSTVFMYTDLCLLTTNETTYLESWYICCKFFFKWFFNSFSNKGIIIQIISNNSVYILKHNNIFLLTGYGYWQCSTWISLDLF